MKELPVYETPQVVSFTEEQILDEMGPAGSGVLLADSEPGL